LEGCAGRSFVAPESLGVEGCAERRFVAPEPLGVEGCAERPFVALGPLGRLCRVAFCCTRATWKPVQGGLLLHQGHFEWRAVQSGLLLH